MVYDIVQENAKRGVSREVIEQQKEQIYSAATHGAKERVKVQFLLQKIAEKEDIKVSQEEIAQRVHYLAGLYQIPPDKFLKDLQKRNGLIEVYDQIMNEKVIEFLQQNAKIEDVPAGSWRRQRLIRAERTRVLSAAKPIGVRLRFGAQLARRPFLGPAQE